VINEDPAVFFHVMEYLYCKTYCSLFYKEHQGVEEKEVKTCEVNGVGTEDRVAPGPDEIHGEGEGSESETQSNSKADASLTNYYISLADQPFSTHIRVGSLGVLIIFQLY
jgi:hypothetical protein